MTTEYVSGCINHKDVRHVRIYYDYMDIYSYNEEKAKIIRILETWTDSKRAQWYKDNYDRLEQGQELKEPDFWITMSHQQFREFMRFSSNAETIKRYLAELEKANHIKRRINPDNPYGAPQYLLQCKVIQKAIDKLATPPYIPTLPTQDTPTESIAPPHKPTPPPGVQIPPTQGDKAIPPLGVNLPPPRGENTPPSNITTNNDSNDNIIEGTFGANAPTHADHQELEKVVSQKISDTDSHLKAVHAANETPYHIAESAIRNARIVEPRLGLPSKAIPASKPVRVADTRDRQVPPTAEIMETASARGEQTPDAFLLSAQAHSVSLVGPEPAQAIPPVAGSVVLPQQAPTAQASGFVPPKRPQLKCDPREVQGRIDAYRGYALEEKVEIIRERTAIKAWCAKHEIGDFDIVLHYLTTIDPYWKLEENKFRIGGLTLAKETPKALAALERQAKSAPKTDEPERGVSGLPKYKPTRKVIYD